MSIPELEQLCAHDFALSTTRPRIMMGLKSVIEKLCYDLIKGEVWIDGSFVKIKVNPADVDLVLRCSAVFYENGKSEQRKTIDWLQNNLKESHFCDSYVFFEWPEEHHNYSIGQSMHNYWMKQFGFSRASDKKGVAVINLLGSSP